MADPLIPAPSVREYDDKNNLIFVDPRQRGETMAFAAQNIIYNIGANFLEPYVNLRVQKYYSSHDASHAVKAGNYTQNLAGEFAGDLIGSGGLMLAEATAPIALHTCTRTMRGWIDPVCAQVADHAFAGQENDPNYQQEKESWKIAQERTLVRAGIVTAGTVAGNIFTQKMILQNPAPTKVIFIGKLLSSTLTTTLGLAARAMFPSHAQGLDRWMSKKIFTPMFEEDAPDASRGR